MSTYLITGGAGFIGSNIVEELLRRGETVRVLDNFSTGRRENLTPFLDRIELIEGDVRSYHIVREAVEGVDFLTTDYTDYTDSVHSILNLNLNLNLNPCSSCSAAWMGPENLPRSSS